MHAKRSLKKRSLPTLKDLKVPKGGLLSPKLRKHSHKKIKGLKF